MPPKTGSESKKSGKKTTRFATPQAYPDQKLSEIDSRRARIIEAALRILDYTAYKKAALITLIRQQLALRTECPECGGGQCQPDQHVFPAVRPLVELHSPKVGRSPPNQSVPMTLFSMGPVMTAPTDPS